MSQNKKIKKTITRNISIQSMTINTVRQSSIIV